MCFSFTLNLNKESLFSSFFTPEEAAEAAARETDPYLQCCFYLDDLLSFVMQSDSFKQRIVDVFFPQGRVDDRTRTRVLSFIQSAYNNPTSSFSCVDTGCNSPAGYLSKNPVSFQWEFVGINFKIGGYKRSKEDLFVTLLPETQGGVVVPPYSWLIPRSMHSAFNQTSYRPSGCG